MSAGAVGQDWVTPGTECTESEECGEEVRDQGIGESLYVVPEMILRSEFGEWD